MEKLLGGIGAFCGSWIGWTAGSHVSFFTALTLSTIGMGVGMYYGRKAARERF
jgi:hypothetical protein